MKVAKDGFGIFHMISGIDTEYTLCGNAFEGQCDGTEEDKIAWDVVEHDQITCKQCLKQIKACKKINLEPTEGVKL